MLRALNYDKEDKSKSTLCTFIVNLAIFTNARCDN